jgi:hypothetical protein
MGGFVRIFGVALCVAAALFSLTVWEAARAAAQAQLRATAAEAIADPVFSESVLASARGLLEGSWAQPLVWHAGAQETLSSIEALRAQRTGNDPAHLGASRDAAVALVKRAAVQPAAWARLAALGLLGQANPLCEPQECLDRSWRASPMLRASLACDRLQIAHAANVSFAHGDDPRIRAYLAATPRTRDALRCLRWLPERARFEAFLYDRFRRARQKADGAYE